MTEEQIADLTAPTHLARPVALQLEHSPQAEGKELSQEVVQAAKTMHQKLFLMLLHYL